MKMKSKLLIGLFCSDQSIPGLFEELIEKFSLNNPDVTIDSVTDIQLADYLIIDTEYLYNHQALDILSQYSHKIILMSGKNNEFNINEILCHYSINHIIGKNGKQAVREIYDCLNRSLICKSWGIEDYLIDPKEIRSAEISTLVNINEYIDKIINEFSFPNFFESPKDYLRLIANELLTNAIFNAAISEDGKKKYSRDHKNRDVKLERNERVSFKMGMNKDYIILSVCDQFGTLTKDQIINSLVRSSRTKTYKEGNEGAGLGMYLIYCTANQLIFNIQKGIRTEVLCIIETNKRFKSFQERITSFHFYQEENYGA